MIVKNLFQKLLILSLSLYTTQTFSSSYWDWRKIDIFDISFPENFIWATVQYSQEISDVKTNTARSAWKKNYNHTIAPKNLLLNGAKIAAELNLSGHAIAVNWAAVEPYQGVYDQEQLALYKKLCEELVQNNIRPIIILKDHLSDPLWFAYNHGFEKRENISLFQNYCLRVIREIMHTEPIIITFQSPEMYAINGYYLQKLAPGKKNAQLVLNVLHHQLEAHSLIYHAIKKLSFKKPLQVGITKYVQPIKPWNKINPLDHIACKFIKEVREKPFITWFTQGRMDVHIPLVAKKIIRNSFAQNSLDFIGIDTSSHIYVKNFKCTTSPTDIKTNIPDATLHPESLYQAIAYSHKHISGLLNIPIYITQSSIATNDDSMRDLFFKRYLYVLSKAIKDGYNVQGYCYWSLFDPYPTSSQKIPTGIISYHATYDRMKLKDGARYFTEIASR